MSYLLPTVSLSLSLLLGVIVTKRLSFFIPKFSQVFFIISLGIVLYTAINYFTSLIFSFPQGILIGQSLILIFEVLYIFHFKISLNPVPYFTGLLKERLLTVLIILIGSILFILFNHHILSNKNGDLYTGESTYGDLPFHLSTISHIVYSKKFPPDNPFFANTQFVYPYLVNFFSSLLVYEGLTLRQSIIIPGLLLSFSLIGLIYDFAFTLLRSSFKSFLTVIFYFFNGGLGYYFFLKDYSFNLRAIFSALSNPSSLTEYSHLFSQNIQWGNFLSRMIVPERSLLFGIPVGLIILRLLFFRDQKKLSNFDLLLASFLLSLLLLLHTHTALVLAFIIPVLTVGKNLRTYLLVYSLAVLFAIPHSWLFLNRVNESHHFLTLHLGWMRGEDESFLWFWFKNTYLLIPLSLIALFSKISKEIKILQICAFILLAVINLVLFSPYNWDNVKFLFWAGLFFDIAAAAVLGNLFLKRNFYLKTAAFFITFSMILTSLLSIWREINVSYKLFSKEAVEVGEEIKLKTPTDSIFLTYKIHNSPVSNLAGRSIMMGYPGLLWVHGINYEQRDKDMNKIFAGDSSAPELLQINHINFVVLEDNTPQELIINREFFKQYSKIIETNKYTVYKIE